MTFGIINFLIFIIYFFRLKNKSLSRFNLYIILVAINLILYFIFPWQQAHLWVFIFSINFILIKLFDNKLIIIFIFLNLFSWFYQINLVDTKYLKHECYNQLVGFEIKPNIKPGFIFEIKEQRIFSKCFPGKNFPDLIKFDQKIKNGKKIF